MTWILLSLLYAVTNAVYTTYNETRNFNGYVLGIWRGFGISLLVAPLLFTVPPVTSASYYLILVIQGLMIGIYDSHLFFASGKYGSHASSGFMATCVLITVFLWWGIDFSELAALMHTPARLITLMLILCGFSVSYWQMMKVRVSRPAEDYLYPAVFALALMSIATRYLALNGGTAYAGVVYYLTVACFVSGVYNAVMFVRQKTPPLQQSPSSPPPEPRLSSSPPVRPHQAPVPKPQTRPDTPPEPSKLALLLAPLPHWQGAWLIAFSTVLIAAKTLALRLAENPGYVIAMLLLSPMFAEVLNTGRIRLRPSVILVLVFLLLLLLLVA